MRQQFTQKEGDTETGLDYFGARYHASMQGRFTTVDPVALKVKHLVNPQDLNKYSYVSNNPLRFIDPDGREKIEIIVRTYIPYPTIKYPPLIGPTFNGNVDSRGQRLPGKEGFKNEQRITIETDAKKGPLVVGTPKNSVGPTHRVSRGVGSIVTPSVGQASGRSLEETG